MSDLPGHDHDPDPAALDELRRAFGGDEPAAEPAEEPADDATSAAEPTPEATSEPAPEPDVEVEGEVQGAPIDDIDPSHLPTVQNPVVEAVVSPELAALGREPAPAVDHEPTPPGLGDDPDPTPDPTPDRDDGDPVDHGPGDAVDEPSTPPVAPPVIRIDDYSGSTTIEPVEPAPFGTNDPPASSTDGDGDGDGGGGVIAISVDDDLPDPVYVEGNLDRDGGGTIVFIENDETGDTLAPDSERDMRRGIEPRMRERRVAVKRAQGRRRLKRVLLIVGVVVLVVGGLAVLGSPLFAVREGDVEVYGAVYSQGDELDTVIEEAVGTPVLRLDTNQIEDELESIPWIEQARVTTDFPYGLVVDIRERAAVSTYQGPDGRFRVLDREGRVLDVIDDGYPYAYVLIGGPDAVDLEPGEFAPQGYAAASELAKNLTSSVRGHVVRIEVLADGSRLTLELDDGSTVYFGEARDILAKLVRLEAVFANGEEREPGLIDVSTSDVTR